MAQRGGSVFSHIRIGGGASPLIGKGEADLIIGFEPGEAVRQLPFLKKGGTVVTSTKHEIPVGAMLGQSSYDPDAVLAYLKQNTEHLVLISAEHAASDLGSSKVLNVVLLGAALKSGSLGLTEADMQQALNEKVPAKFLELNRRAFSWSESGHE